jgi:hypothetical protein
MNGEQIQKQWGNLNVFYMRLAEHFFNFGGRVQLYPVATGSLVYGSKWNQTGRAKSLIRRTVSTTRILEHAFYTMQKEGYATDCHLPAKFQRRTEFTRRY